MQNKAGKQTYRFECDKINVLTLNANARSTKLEPYTVYKTYLQVCRWKVCIFLINCVRLSGLLSGNFSNSASAFHHCLIKKKNFGDIFRRRLRSAISNLEKTLGTRLFEIPRGLISQFSMVSSDPIKWMRKIKSEAHSRASLVTPHVYRLPCSLRVTFFRQKTEHWGLQYVLPANNPIVIASATIQAKASGSRYSDKRQRSDRKINHLSIMVFETNRPSNDTKKPT